MLLSNEQLLEIEGGINTLTFSGILGGIIFLIGIVSGFVRPIKCSK